MEIQREPTPEASPKKLEWVAPVVSELPLPEVTRGGFLGIGADNGIYS